MQELNLKEFQEEVKIVEFAWNSFSNKYAAVNLPDNFFNGEVSHLMSSSLTYILTARVFTFPLSKVSQHIKPIYSSLSNIKNKKIILFTFSFNFFPLL